MIGPHKVRTRAPGDPAGDARTHPTRALPPSWIRRGTVVAPMALLFTSSTARSADPLRLVGSVDISDETASGRLCQAVGYVLQLLTQIALSRKNARVKIAPRA